MGAWIPVPRAAPRRTRETVPTGDHVLPSIDEMRMAYPSGLFNAAGRDGPTSRQLRREVAKAQSAGATRRDLVDGGE